MVLDTLERGLGPNDKPSRGDKSPELEVAEPPRWTLQQAQALLVLIEPVFNRWRFNVGLYGSVMRDNIGTDLDLIAWPQMPEAFAAYEMIMADLVALGMTRLPDEYRALNGGISLFLRAKSGRLIDLVFKP